MGPKKEAKKEVQKRENGTGNESKFGIEEAINSDSWKCAVAMAVERTNNDCFLLQDFLEGSSSGLRPEVGVIDFDTFVMKILNEFANGELSHKYAFLLNFSTVFQEAVDCINKQLDIPVPVLVKIVKALLFYLKEENLSRVENVIDYFPDPIKAMAERPYNIEMPDLKKKDTTKKPDNGVKLKPPSVMKQDTELLKRGEKVKIQHCIQDAPQNSYFNLHVLLTGFYNPDFPLELIKANIPLHAVICIDASRTGRKEDASFERKAFQKHKSETKSEAIQNFWEKFLVNIWDPKLTFHFKDTIFQIYLPPKLVCEKKKLQEFIYREISYLMYDLSDFKRQLNNYLNNMNVRDMQRKEINLFAQDGITWPGCPPNECVSVPVILQRIIDEISGHGTKFQRIYSAGSTDSGETEWGLYEKDFPPSKQALYGSCTVGPGWSEELEKKGDINLLKIYLKTEELDLIYDLENKNVKAYNSEKAVTEVESSQTMCNFQQAENIENGEELLLLTDGSFRSYWKKYDKRVKTVYGGDRCLFALLMTKVICPQEDAVERQPARSTESSKSNVNLDLIENSTTEMRKPHFTITEGSRNINQSLPCNMRSMSRHFFSPEQYKTVSLEKLKASSAPEFRTTPGLKIQTLYTSEVFPREISKNPFENLKGFVSENLFSNTTDFDFLEILSKSKLLEKEHEHWNDYNCIDDAYSHWNDCILLTLHNRKNSENIHHEIYNKTLRTPVGLRDFYNYVLEDEKQWFTMEEESYRARTFLKNKVLSMNSLKQLSDYHFWLVNSLKYQTYDKTLLDRSHSREIKTELSTTESEARGKFCIKNVLQQKFDAFNVSDVAVQFSGLRTEYYSNDCSVTVQLSERLYGNQELGIHVKEASHTLHLYSYACPVPRLLDPFKFHVTYKNGIVIAFSRHLTEAQEAIGEGSESTVAVENNKNSSELSMELVKRQISGAVKDDEFAYNFSASLPNGLSIQTVCEVVEPCYIKQYYLVDCEEISKVENSRLFLPNGNVVKMMNNHTVQILKVNATIVTANLSDLIKETQSGNLDFTRCEVISGDGKTCAFHNGVVTSKRRMHVFQNTDMETHEVFFRRRDGTNYMLQSDGTLCVEFSDGTKMSSSVFVQEEPIDPTYKDEPNHPKEENISEKNDLDSDFVFVFTKVIIEHPDYATVIYDSRTQTWRILLPYNSAITIHSNGVYDVAIDNQTELKVEADLIQMNNISNENGTQCSFTADLSAFEKKERGPYCNMKDGSGKTFIIEGNSNSYVINEGKHSGGRDFQEEAVAEISGEELFNFVASETCASISSVPSMPLKSRKLLRENKYFVVRRDVTGAEIMHKEDVRKALTKTQKGSLLFTENIPGSENRCFVLVTPLQKKEIKKWGVESIIPNPKYEPGAVKRTCSSTYGFPPSWMHPFPKKKLKFVVPHPLTCRVFIETQKTDLSPETGAIDCYYCEMSEQDEAKRSLISPDGVEEYLKRLSADDQDLLTEIYSLAAASLIEKNKKLKPTNSEKLEHYLEMSRYYVAMREHHKKCIRYHLVPNYFHHPAGMSWLILNDLLLTLQLPSEKKKQISSTTTDSARSSSELTSSCKEEIEYNLSVRSCQSFSSLSYRSDLSAATAPEVLRMGGFCRCRIKAPKAAASSIPVWNGNTVCDSYTEDPPPRLCELQENVQILRKQCDAREVALLSLEDLMYLGFI